LILTAFGDPANVLGLLAAGAQGYLLKDADPDELLKGIHALAEGRTWLCPAAAQILKWETLYLAKLLRIAGNLSPLEKKRY
jgi:DNA-binding NarL/FixJ family response regulator